MTFLNLIFAWGLLTVSVPIAIALWAQFRPKEEKFGGFYLLQKLLEVRKRHIRLLELLKLLNRIALVTLIVLYFANPSTRILRNSSAENGFVIMVDVGRALQMTAPHSTQSLAAQTLGKLAQTLDLLPSSSRGALLVFSDQCEALRLDDATGRLTGTAAEWTTYLNKNSLPFDNLSTTSEGVADCLSRSKSLFEDKKIYRTLLSPLPTTLDIEVIKRSEVEVQALSATAPGRWEKPSITQNLEGDRVKLSIIPSRGRDAQMIFANREEKLGEVTETLELVNREPTWLLLSERMDLDPWAGKSLVALKRPLAKQVTLWSAKETPGYLSLLTALRSHPDFQVNRQVGGEPTVGTGGDPIIIYGSFPFSREILGKARVWFFVDPEGASPFKVRDKKLWTAGGASSDTEKSFRLKTQDGNILLRRYSLFELDDFDMIESFEDGAPALLKLRSDAQTAGAAQTIWVSPFDLEDLTTDLALEPTFIPYLYRRLETWLNSDEASSALAEPQTSKPMWLMKGAVVPRPQVLAHQEWPGIYQVGEKTVVVEPQPLPEGFHSYSAAAPDLNSTSEEWVSKRALWARLIWISVFLELLLCLLSALDLGAIAKRLHIRYPKKSKISFRSRKVAGWLAVGFVMASATAAMDRSLYSQTLGLVRRSEVGVWATNDHDRDRAVAQVAMDFEHLSNLDFSKPQLAAVSTLTKFALIIVSSTQSFGPFSKPDREKIREYCERGGLFFFDDPLAVDDSEFFRSVKKELAEIFPGRDLQSVSKEDVLFRTFYLLNEVSGRKLASPELKGVNFDRRWVAVFSSNDLLGANLRSSHGEYALSVSPYGLSQRNLARRMLLNIFMYSVTLDYKDDAIHLPHILRRRSR